MSDCLVSLTEEEQEIVKNACDDIFELGVECHSSDKHVVEKMIQSGYRKSDS